MKIHKLAWAAPMIWAAFVLVLHVMPVHLDKDSSLRIPHADKVVHFAMFAGLSFLLLRAAQISRKGAATGKMMVFIAVVCASYGGLLEFVQSLTPAKRDSDILDWCADLVGTLAGLYAAWKEWFALIFLHQIRKAK